MTKTTPRASCFVHDEHNEDCKHCRVEHRRAVREGEYLVEGGFDEVDEGLDVRESIKPGPREKEVMVEDWRTVQEVKEALGLRGEPFHAKVQGNGVMFAYPQLKEDTKNND